MPPTGTSALFDAYIRRAHYRYPFLELTTITGLQERAANALTNPLTDEESFRAYMILAIGAVYMKQKLPSSNDCGDPLDLFSKAVRSAKSVNFFNGIRGVQNLLLVARFGFFHSVGISLWHISFLCIRTCVECGFHRQPTSRLPPVEEQMRRRVFWQSYILGRHFSSTLGRPFLIPDEAVTVGLTANVNDEALRSAAERYPSASLDEIMAKQSSLGDQRTDLSLAIAHTCLWRVASRIYHDFRSLRRRMAANDASLTSSSPSPSSVFESSTEVSSSNVWSIYGLHMDKLYEWRQASSRESLQQVSSPSTPETFLQDARWIDLHFHQEKLSLIRLSIEPRTSTSTNASASRKPGSCLINPLDLVDELYDAASNVIMLYSELIGEAKIEPSTGRLYRILTACLSVLYSVILETQQQQQKHERKQTDGDDALSRQWFAVRKSILGLCANTLDRMAKQVTAEQLTPKYVACFELLCKEVLAGVLPDHQGAVSSSHHSSPNGYHLTCLCPGEHLPPCYCGLRVDETDMFGATPSWMSSSLFEAQDAMGSDDMFLSHWQESSSGIWQHLMQAPVLQTDQEDFFVSEVP